MAWTLAQLNALDEAIALGTTTVEYQGKKVTYRSLDEMLRVRDVIRRELGLAGGEGTRVKMKFDKGLG